MTGDQKVEGRYWPTALGWAVLNGLCPCSGIPVDSCPCAVADNNATGQGDEAGAA